MRRRNESLDFLRCIGINFTILSHLRIDGNSIPERIASFLKIGGWIGVDLFFVLSGFLVSSLIFKEQQKYARFRPLRFLIRRGFKIYPALYLFLAITWGMTYYFHYASAESNRKYLYEAVYICNYMHGAPIHGWLWSICVEEHFYILLSVLLFFLIKYKRLNSKTIFSIYLLLLVLATASRIYNLRYPEFKFFRDCARSHERLDSLFWGVVLAYLYQTRQAIKWNLPILLSLSLLLISIPFFFDIEKYRFVSIFSLAINPLCFGYVMMSMLPIQRAWMRPLAYIGKYSYSIYLFHGLVNTLAGSHFSGWKYYLVYIAGTFLLGTLVSRIFEYALLKLRDKWFPAPRIGAASSIAPVYK